MSDIERQERLRIAEALRSDFELHEGWQGRHKHGGERVFYDLIARPRSHLVEAGFDDGHFVIEVKMFNANDRQPHDVKARDLFWQCVVYSFSEIELPNGDACRPLFTVYFIGGSGIDPQYKSEVTQLHHFVQRGGVGKLELGNNDWLLRFGPHRYFSKLRGKGPHNVGVKRQVGSAR